MARVGRERPLLGVLVVFGVGSRWRDGDRWTKLVAGVLLDVLSSTAAGAIVCLPRDWLRRLQNGQEHSQRDVFHGDTIVGHYQAEV